jgi:hypothetical protein
MLDSIGLARCLAIKGTGSLWGSDADLLHTTSVLRYPVLVGGKNYNGTPQVEQNQVSERWFRTTFVADIAKIKEAIIIPPGPKVARQIQRLIGEEILRESRVLLGLPHPSGANAERIAGHTPAPGPTGDYNDQRPTTERV